MLLTKLKLKKAKLILGARVAYLKNSLFVIALTEGGAFKSVKYLANSNKEVWFCGCKRTKRQPFCDGSHSKS